MGAYASTAAAAHLERQDRDGIKTALASGYVGRQKQGITLSSLVVSHDIGQPHSILFYQNNNWMITHYMIPSIWQHITYINDENTRRYQVAILIFVHTR